MMYVTSFPPSWIRVYAFFGFFVCRISSYKILGLGLLRQKAWTLSAGFLNTFLQFVCRTSPRDAICKAPSLPGVCCVCIWKCQFTATSLSQGLVQKNIKGKKSTILVLPKLLFKELIEAIRTEYFIIIK